MTDLLDSNIPPKQIDEIKELKKLNENHILIENLGDFGDIIYNKYSC